MMFDLSKIFDLSKKFALPDTLLKSKNFLLSLHSRISTITISSDPSRWYHQGFSNRWFCIFIFSKTSKEGIFMRKLKFNGSMWVRILLNSYMIQLSYFQNVYYLKHPLVSHGPYYQVKCR